MHSGVRCLLLRIMWYRLRLLCVYPVASAYAVPIDPGADANAESIPDVGALCKSIALAKQSNDHPYHRGPNRAADDQLDADRLNRAEPVAYPGAKCLPAVQFSGRYDD